MDELQTVRFLISINQKSDAKKVLDIIKPYCKTIPQIDAVGALYSEIRAFRECVELANKALSLTTNLQEQLVIKSNLARSHTQLGEPQKSLEYLEELEKYNPNNHEMQMDKALALFFLNRKPEGEEILRKILTEPRTDDIDARVNFNLGTYELERGNFQSGLKKFLIDGKRFNTHQTFKLPVQNQWQGGIQEGKTVLMCAEGGIGDEIISVRFQKHLKDAGMRPIWYTDRKDLADVFNRNGFETITSLMHYKYDWLWCYSMSTPYYLGISEDDLWYGPYLKSINKAKKLDGKLKIGIKCLGNPYYEQDLHRSIPLDQILQCLPENATIYSFHVDEEINDPRVITLKDDIKTWDDTLDFLNQMDLVVSSCTSLAHAASAMAKETVVMVPILNYYTWARPGRHSKWYSDKTTILRQTECRDWNSTLRELKDYIHEFCDKQDQRQSDHNKLQ